jgi:hypothetical protein
VVTSIDSDGTLCTLDPVTGKQTAVPSGREFVYQVTPTPDGKSLLVPLYTYPNAQVAVFNAHTLAQTSTLTVSGDTSSAGSMIVSPDSSTLYMSGSGILYAYDLTSGAAVGWMSSLDVQPVSGGMGVGSANGPNLQAFDGTGLLAGPMEEGVGFLDTKTLRAGQVGAIFTNSYLTPATGPETGGTQVQFENLSGTTDLTAVYFGASAASGTSAGKNFFYATTPPGAPGPADVYATMADGSMLMVPEGFSFGPTILEVTPGSATAEGGGTGYIFGYGFGSTVYNAPIPAGLQITVGGRPANVTTFFPNAYGLSSPPFNLQGLSFTIPASVAGTSADVAVIAQSGTATKSNGLQYLPAVRQIPLPGAALAQGVYDAKRDLYYFTDAAQIRVYSRTEGQWLNSIQVPAASPGITHRLWGIALSADGSKLAVSDASAQLIYLIDPGSPAMVQSFPVLTYFAGFPLHQNGVITNPAGLAVSNAGSIYYAAFTTGGDGYDGFFKLDTITGKVTDYKMDAFGLAQYKVAVAGDQTKAYFNNDGSVFTVATATDQVTYATVDTGCCYGDYDLAVASNGNTVEATGYLYDANLNANSYLVLNDRESLVAQYVYGTKLSPDGGLLFQPGVNGIDVFDARLGTVRAQISLPVALSQNFDALVSDGKDNVLVAITGQTGNGIAVVDLSSLGEPTPLPYLGRSSGESARNLNDTAPSGEPKSIHSNRGNKQVPMPAVRHVLSPLSPGGK